MFKFVIALATLMVASAFTPAFRSARSSGLKMSYENEIGAIGFAVRGTEFCYDALFDPLNLSKDIDQAKFDKYRTNELKHGRVAMLAVVGYIVPEIFKFPGIIAPGVTFDSIPNGLAAIEAVPALGWAQILALVGYIDKKLSEGEFPYPFAFEQRPFTSPEAEKNLKERELSNGRLAMLAILELIRHDYTTAGTGARLIEGLPLIY